MVQILILVCFVYLTLALYTVYTDKQLFFSFPIWIDVDFYLTITKKTTKIGLIKY